MNILLLGIVCALQCSWVLEAMESSSKPTIGAPSSASDFTAEDLHNKLRERPETKQFSEFFNPAISENHRKRAEAVISFMKEELGDRTSFNDVLFFEIFKQMTLDPTISNEEFRKFIVDLPRDTGTAAIIFLHEASAQHGDSARPKSLTNFGNSCYLNASCQLAFQLSREPALTKAFAINRASSLQKRFLQLCQYAGDDTSFTDVLRAFETECRTTFFQAKNGERDQQDNQELLVGLLDGLSEPSSPTNKGSNEQKIFAAVADLFSIHQSEAIVKSIDHVPGPSNTYSWQDLPPSSMIDLALKNDETPLTQLLQEQFGQETVDLIRAPEITSQKFDKITKLKATGPFLFVNVKRAGSALNRIAHTTPFPLRLNPTNCFIDEGTAKQYELVGVVMHAGQSARSGHYVSYARGLENGVPVWFYCSDSHIQKISDEEMVRISYRGYGDPWAGYTSLPVTWLYKALDKNSQLPPASHIAMFMAAYNKSGTVHIQKVSLSDDEALQNHGPMAQALEKLLIQPLNTPTDLTQSNDSQKSFLESLTKTEMVLGAIVVALAYAFANQKLAEEKAKKEREEKRKKLKILLNHLNKVPSMAVSPDPTEPPKA